MAGGRDERVADLFFVDQSAAGNPDEEGLVRYVNADLKALIGGVVVSLISGSGMTPEQHRVLDQLVHDLDENYYEEFTYSGNDVVTNTIWTDAGKTEKIREYAYTYGLSHRVLTETIRQYAAGVLVETLTLTYGYTGSRITSVACVRS